MQNDDDMREAEAAERKVAPKGSAGDVDDLIFRGEPEQRTSSR